MSSQRRPQNPQRTSLWPDVAAALLLALCIGAFFWRTLSGDVFQPADGGDLVSFLYPTYRFAAATLASGELPLWNPTLYGGAPFLADIQAGFLYPPNLLLFLLNPEFGYGWMQWLSIGHLWWAGLGIYVLCRVLGISRPAALFAGIAFACSDPLLIHLGNLNLIAVLSWLGWVLAALQRALVQRSLAWAGVAGLLFALANYAGHAQSSYYLGLAVGVYWLLSLPGGGPKRKDTEKSFRPLLSRLANSRLSTIQYPLLTGILALLLTAPLLLPALELLPYTARADLAYQENVGYSLAPVPALVGLITPGFFGRGPALHWSFWDRVELPYVGVVALLLAIAVFYRPATRRDGVVRTGSHSKSRNPTLLPWIGLALFGLLIALGVYTPVHGWLTQLLPGFDAFRAPARAIVLWALSVAVLAGYGLDWVTDRAPWTTDDRRRRTDEPHATQRPTRHGPFVVFLKWGGLVLLVVFVPAIYASLLALQPDSTWFLRASLAGLSVALATAAWLGTWALVSLYNRGLLNSRIVVGLLTLLLLIEVGANGAYTDISESDPAQGFNHPQVVAFLQGDDGQSVEDEQPGMNASSVALSQSPAVRIDARTDIDNLWQPDTAALVGLRDVWGIVNPLLLNHWDRLWESSGGRQSQLYDMLNAGYVLVRDGTPLPDKFVLAFDAPGGLAVYRNPDAFPRAWLVADVVIVPDDDAALAALTAPGFDPGTTAILLAGDHGPWATDDRRSSAIPPSGNPLRVQYPVSIVSSTANTLRLGLTSPTAAILVLSEVWYPGWRATVNGIEAPVLRVNYALRGVEVPAGDANVELIFAPQSWRWGLGLAGLGVLLLVGLLVGRAWGAQTQWG